jgi:hypothetical protein
MDCGNRLVDKGARGREISTGKLFTKLVNGERGAAHEDGPVNYKGSRIAPRMRVPADRLRATDRAAILKAINQAVTRLYVEDKEGEAPGE